MDWRGRMKDEAGPDSGRPGSPTTEGLERPHLGLSGAPSRGARVLLTGCTGFVGKVALEELLRRREELGVERVYLLVRPRRTRSATVRFEKEVASSPCFSRLALDWRDRCHPVGGDITAPDLGLDGAAAARLHEDVTHIIHCAASVKFDLPIAEAAHINITGALQVLEFAQRCTHLSRLVDVSTAYVTPYAGRGAAVEEALVDLPFDAEEVYADILAGRADEAELLRLSGQANTYTLTKCLAEIVLTRRRGDTPLTLLRPSVVSACRRFPFPGWIDSHAAYAAFISLLGTGYLRAIRIDPGSAADLVPCDDVADRIISCAFRPSLQRPLVIRHAVAGLDNSGTLSQLARHHERYFQAHPHEKKARWAYAGRSRTWFHFHDWLHHRVALGAAKTLARVQRRKADYARIERLADSIGRLDEAFHYFAHHTFDFRTDFPPLEDFHLEDYLDTVSAGISEHLLKRDPRHAPLRMHGTDLRWAVRQPDGNAAARALAYLTRKMVRAARANITFDEAELKAALREVGSDELVVLAPSHGSHFDFLITSLLCFAHPGLGLRTLRVAAPSHLRRVPIVGRLLESTGAIYLEHRHEDPDPTHTRSVTELSRRGRALRKAGRPAVMLPLSISYERPASEGMLVHRPGGHGPSGRALGPVWRWVTRLLRGDVDLGHVHISCGAQQRLDMASNVQELRAAS